MGFTFSGIHTELASERFKKFYGELRIESSLLDSFPSSSALIQFFHDAENRAYDIKDSILCFLIAAYRRGGKYTRLSPLFIALFANAVAAVYRMSKRINHGLDDEEFFQDACVTLLHIVSEARIAPRRVALQVTNRLKNESWRSVNRGLRQSRFEVAMPMDRIVPVAGSDEDTDIGTEIPDAPALLDDLVRKRVITRADRKIVIATVIDGKPLKNISDPGQYERLKKRRQRAIRAIEVYLANKMKS